MQIQAPKHLQEREIHTLKNETPSLLILCTASINKMSSVTENPTSPSPNGHNHHQHKDLVNLKLRKPQAWNWELTTSKSSSSINFPRIRLFDHHNRLLAEADEADKVLGNVPRTAPRHGPTEHSGKTAAQPNSASKRSRTADLSDFIDALRQQMTAGGYECKVVTRQRKSSERPATKKAFDVVDNGNDGAEDIDAEAETKPITVTLPAPLRLQSDHSHHSMMTMASRKPRSRSSSSRTVVVPPQQQQQPATMNDDSAARTTGQGIKSANFSLQKSRSSAAVMASGMRTTEAATQPPPPPAVLSTKKKAAAGSLRFSPSILERLSDMKRRTSTSSSESSTSTPPTVNATTPPGPIALSGQSYTPPRYELRSCPAGTLVVRCDSYETNANSANNSRAGQMRRRRRRNRRSTSAAHGNGDTPTADRKAAGADEKTPMLEPSDQRLSVGRYSRAIESIEHLINRAQSTHAPKMRARADSAGNASDCAHRKHYTPSNCIGEVATSLTAVQQQQQQKQNQRMRQLQTTSVVSPPVQATKTVQQRRQLQHQRQRSASAGPDGERLSSLSPPPLAMLQRRRKCWSSLSSSSSSSLSSLPAAHDMDYGNGQVARARRKARNGAEHGIQGNYNKRTRNRDTKQGEHKTITTSDYGSRKMLQHFISE